MYRSVSDLSSVVQDFFRVHNLKPLLMLERASDGLSFYEVKDWIGLEVAVYFVSLFTRASVILKRSQFSGVSHPLSNLDPKKVHFCVELNWNSLLHLVLTFVVGKFLCFSMLLSTVFSNLRLVDNEIPKHWNKDFQQLHHVTLFCGECHRCTTEVWRLSSSSRVIASNVNCLKNW